MKHIMFYMTLNYPNNKSFFDILEALSNEGMTYLELGIPVEDPFMDGEIIQQSHDTVLKNGLNQADVIEILKQIKEKYSFKIILMTYYAGVEKYDLLSHENLYDGLLCVDKNLTKKDLNKPIQLYPPKMDGLKMKEKLQNNETFAYVISGEGKTGSFDDVPTDYVDTIKNIRKFSDIPAFVGFGIKTKEDAESVFNNDADGVIIGTALMKEYIEGGIPGIKDYLKTFK